MPMDNFRASVFSSNGFSFINTAELLCRPEFNPVQCVVVMIHDLNVLKKRVGLFLEHVS